MSLVGLAALSLRAQPMAGSIVAHGINAASSHVVIDAQQNVYSYDGGVCGQGFLGPIICQPTIIKADATGAVVFTITLSASVGIGGLTVDAAGEVYFVGVSQGPLPTSSNAALPASSTGGPFAAKLSADGSAFLYLTYLPSALAGPGAVQLDSEGNGISLARTPIRSRSLPHSMPTAPRFCTPRFWLRSGVWARLPWRLTLPATP